MKDPFIDALLAHAEADIPRQESYDRFGQSCIRYLKNVGLLGCRFDPWTCDEIIFITKSGKDYVRIYKNDLMLKDIVDYAMSGRPQEGPEFEAVLRKAAGPLARRCCRRTVPGFLTGEPSRAGQGPDPLGPDPHPRIALRSPSAVPMGAML